jgi:Zn-finger protein
MLENGIKDCSCCLLPHGPKGHEYVVGKLRAYFEKMKKQKGNKKGSENKGPLA